MTKLGERLRQIRTEKNLSLYEVEKDTGISFSLLSKYERGERIPSQQRLTYLANYYNVSIDWLLGRTDNRNMMNSIMASEPVQKYLSNRQSQVLQGIVRDLADVPQEDLSLVADLVKRLAEKSKQVEKPRQPATLAAHGGEIKNKQAVMRYVERRRREAEAKRRKQKDDETPN